MTWKVLAATVFSKTMGGAWMLQNFATYYSTWMRFTTDEIVLLQITVADFTTDEDSRRYVDAAELRHLMSHMNAFYYRGKNFLQ